MRISVGRARVVLECWWNLDGRGVVLAVWAVIWGRFRGLPGLWAGWVFSRGSG